MEKSAADNLNQNSLNGPSGREDFSFGFQTDYRNTVKFFLAKSTSFYMHIDINYDSTRSNLNLFESNSDSDFIIWLLVQYSSLAIELGLACKICKGKKYNCNIFNNIRKMPIKTQIELL